MTTATSKSTRKTAIAILPDGNKAIIDSLRPYRYCVAELRNGRWWVNRWTVTEHQAKQVVRKLTDPYAIVSVEAVTIIKAS